MFDAEEEPGDLVVGDGGVGLVLSGVIHFHGVLDGRVEGYIVLYWGSGTIYQLGCAVYEGTLTIVNHPYIKTKTSPYNVCAKDQAHLVQPTLKSDADVGLHG